MDVLFSVGGSKAELNAAVAAFLPHAPGAADEDVIELLQRAGRDGTGLASLLRAAGDSAGRLFGSVLRLRMLSDMAVANKVCARSIAGVAADVLAVVDSAARRGCALDGDLLDALTSVCDDASALVDGLSQPGWLLRVACNERMKEEFDVLHDALLEILKSAGLAASAGAEGRGLLPRPSYRDAARPLRRALRQLGRGDMASGVAHLRCSEAALTEVARLLEVPPRALEEEVAMLPDATGVELDVLYQRLLLRPAAAAAATGSHCPGVSPASLRMSAAGSTAPSSSAAVSSAGGSTGQQQQQQQLYVDLFRFYDTDSSGSIDAHKLKAVLADLGLLEGKSEADAMAITVSHLHAVAGACGGAQQEGVPSLQFEDFCRLYDSLLAGAARAQLRCRLGAQADDDLHATFVAFASFGSREPLGELDGARFQKLCRDCGLLCGGITATDADLIFAKAKSKGARKLNYDGFISALSMLCQRKGCTLLEAAALVLRAGGPVAHGTRAEAVRLHDDKSTYTGVYARGGPSSVDQMPFDLGTLVDRSVGQPPSPRRPDSSKRSPLLASGGVISAGGTPAARSTGAGSAVRGSAGGCKPNGRPAPSPFAEGRRRSRASADVADDAGALRDASPAAQCGGPAGGAANGATAAAPAMAPSNDGSSTPSDGGSAAVRKLVGGYTISGRYSTSGGFSSFGGVQESVAAPQQPQPALIPAAGARTPPPADVRAVFAAFASFGLHHPSPRSPASKAPGALRATPPSAATRHAGGGSAGRLGGGGRQPGSSGAAGAAAAATELDGVRFAKLCREAGLVDAMFNTNAADLIFAKVKTKGSKRISFAQFSRALELIAEDKEVPLADVVAAVEACGGPAINSMLAR